MSISDILIHVVNDLTAQQRHALEETMRDVSGVIAPRFSPGRDHLLLVAFNPERVRTDTLLARVLSAGYDARLVGG